MKLITLIKVLNPMTTITIHKIDKLIFIGEIGDFWENDELRKFDHKKVELVSSSGYDIIQISI